MAGKVVPFPQRTASEEKPSAAALEPKVHALAKNTANLRFDHPHFQARLIVRKITMRQVLEVLRHGAVKSGPTKDQWGDWRIKLQRKVAGRRVQVVVAVKDKHLDVVTAI